MALSPSERSWAAATTEGLLLYSLDEGMVFDPTDLGEEVTPQAVHAALAAKKPLRALLIALRLADPALLRHVLMSTPPKKVRSPLAAVRVSFALDRFVSCSTAARSACKRKCCLSGHAFASRATLLAEG